MIDKKEYYKKPDYDLWKRLYQGYASEIHDYKEFVKGKWVDKCLSSSGMAKQAGEDWASIILGEQLHINTGIKDLDKYLDEEFIPKFTIFLEKYMCLGQGLIYPFVDDDLLNNNFYVGDEFEVLSFQRNTPKEVIIYHEKYNTKLKYDVDEDMYYVTHEKTKEGEEDKGFELPDGDEFKGKINYFKPNTANNISMTQHGISVYANAIDILRDIDINYTDTGKEFALSRKRLFIPRQLLKSKGVDEKGNFTNELEFDVEENLYQLIGNDEQGFKLTEFSPDIRVDDYHKQQDKLFNLYGKSVGLTDYYNESKRGNLSGNKTAKEVISEKSNLFRNKRKHEKIARAELIKVIHNFAELLNKKIKNDKKIQIEFDDSIIIDDEQEFENDLKLVEAELMSKEAFIIKHRKLSEKELKDELELLADADDLIPNNDDDDDSGVE